MSDKPHAEFLEKLEALCRLYGIAVEGCGCCDSPRIDPHIWEPDETIKLSRGDRGFEICRKEGDHIYTPHRKCVIHGHGWECE